MSQFFRTLDEQRKHQECWRKMQLVEDAASRNLIDSGGEGISGRWGLKVYFLFINLNKIHLNHAF